MELYTLRINTINSREDARNLIRNNSVGFDSPCDVDIITSSGVEEYYMEQSNITGLKTLIIERKYT
ncbi:hypothetical protein GCM10008013_11730 [Paenibacillus segetis]|uniref:Uncharacterized protein n=1 Tax=Paenibacillus segetis TaxID=1325360 RepID=A0ABQ1Y9N5_9BACL|nr:hypothetical protein GCM10008013_11730 [Paenibacillus segetis]